MVLPLVQKGNWVEFTMGGVTYTMKCFNANPSTVWVEDPKGKILKLHKLRNFIKVVEEPVKDKEDSKEKKPQQILNNLKKNLTTPSTTSSGPTRGSG